MRAEMPDPEHGTMVRDPRDEWPRDEPVGSFDIEQSRIEGIPVQLVISCSSARTGSGVRCSLAHRPWAAPARTASVSGRGTGTWSARHSRRRSTASPRRTGNRLADVGGMDSSRRGRCVDGFCRPLTSCPDGHGTLRACGRTSPSSGAKQAQPRERPRAHLRQPLR